MAEKLPDNWKEATEAPLQRGVDPVANKEFGPKTDLSEGTDANLEAKSALAWGNHPSLGTNDVNKVSTVAPISGSSPNAANRPVGWPPSFEKR